MQKTDALKEIIGTHAWVNFKQQLSMLHAEARDQLVQMCSKSDIGEIRQQRGFCMGIERVFNEMVTLEGKDEQ